MLPAHTDDVDNEPTDDAAVAEPDGVPAQGLETELASHSQTQIPRDAPVSSMPDMNSRPSGGASLSGLVIGDSTNFRSEWKQALFVL